jgi:hypothetical protein
MVHATPAALLAAARALAPHLPAHRLTFATLYTALATRDPAALAPLPAPVPAAALAGLPSLAAWTSDAGWGCTLRSTQMLLANTLLRHFRGMHARDGPDPGAAAFLPMRLPGDEDDVAPAYLPAAPAPARAAASQPSPLLLLPLLTWFADAPSAPYSLHQLLYHAGQPPGVWFAPGEAVTACARAVHAAAAAAAPSSAAASAARRGAASPASRAQVRGQAKEAAAWHAIAQQSLLAGRRAAACLLRPPPPEPEEAEAEAVSIIAPAGVPHLRMYVAHDSAVVLGDVARLMTGAELPRVPADRERGWLWHQVLDTSHGACRRMQAPDPARREDDDEDEEDEDDVARAQARDQARDTPCRDCGAPAAGCLIAVPLRLGVDVVPAALHGHLRRALSSRFSAGIVGGAPRSSYWFYGHQGSRLLYLDPHTTQPAQEVDVDALQQGPHSHCSEDVLSIDAADIDPSLCVAYYVRDLLELDEFAAEMQAMRAEFSVAGPSSGSLASSWLFTVSQEAPEWRRVVEREHGSDDDFVEVGLCAEWDGDEEDDDELEDRSYGSAGQLQDDFETVEQVVSVPSHPEHNQSFSGQWVDFEDTRDQNGDDEWDAAEQVTSSEVLALDDDA